MGGCRPREWYRRRSRRRNRQKQVGLQKWVQIREDVGIAIDIITSSQFIKDPQTLNSNGGNFIMGIFSPENSTNRYVGIWWMSQSTVIWVANRNQPLKNSSGVVKISEDGNLVVLNGQNHVIWSSNVSNITSKSNSISKLLDYGNLVLLENTTGNTLWESFLHPTDMFSPNMKSISFKITGEEVRLNSWKSPSDPSIGSFSCSVECLNLPEVFIWNETRPYWCTGPWDGRIFTGLPYMKALHLTGLSIADDGQGTIDFSVTKVDQLGFLIYVLNSEGNILEKWWDDKKEWQVTWNNRPSDRDIYGICGAFASCSSQSSPICSCLRGFQPKNTQEWNRQNWTRGCVTRTPLQCERVNNQNRSADSKEDGFLKQQMVKVPDFAQRSSVNVTQDTCRSQCLENCSCIAYSYDPGIGCMSWTGNLIDIKQFSSGGLDLYIRVAYTELDKERNKRVINTILVIIGVVIIVTCACHMEKVF